MTQIAESIPMAKEVNVFFLNHCTMHINIYKVQTPTNTLYITLDKILKFTLKSLWLAPTCFGLRP